MRPNPQPDAALPETRPTPLEVGMSVITHSVTIELGQRLNAHLRCCCAVHDLVQRMHARQYRWSSSREYWAVPLTQVEDLAEELRGAGYDVEILRGAA